LLIDCRGLETENARARSMVGYTRSESFGKVGAPKTCIGGMSPVGPEDPRLAKKGRHRGGGIRRGLCDRDSEGGEAERLSVMESEKKTQHGNPIAQTVVLKKPETPQPFLQGKEDDQKV